MKKCRLKIRSGYYCDYTASTMARENFLELFTHEKTRPDAVCCLNDYCAGSLIKELTKRQIDLNGILFSGFDHSPLSEFIPQPLLTANPPMEEMGKEAANMLIRQVENPNFAYQRKKLKSRLITTK
jgi:DNA-binding LacI/PurR family transcriptional regulator